MGSGPLQVIKELSKPVWIVEKQPANHCLKPCGLPIDSRIGATRTTTGTVAPSTDQVLLLCIEDWQQPVEGCGLGICANLGHDGFMESVRLARTLTQAKALMQFPDRISNPGQLQRTNGLRR